MTTATAEKPTCQYALGTDDFVYTSCGQTRFPDVVNNYTYCPDCGRKIDLEVAKGERAVANQKTE